MSHAFARSCVLLLACAFAPAAPAADIAAQLERAGAAAARDDHAAAIGALEEALDAVREEAPLTLQPFVLVEKPAAMFGDIHARADASYSGSEPLLFYMEPKNLVYARSGGLYKPGFSVDLAVLDADGEVIASQDKFGAFDFSSQSRFQDIFVNLTLTLTGVPAGDYTVRFTVRDANSKKSATVEKTITRT